MLRSIVAIAGLSGAVLLTSCSQNKNLNSSSSLKQDENKTTARYLNLEDFSITYYEPNHKFYIIWEHENEVRDVVLNVEGKTLSTRSIIRVASEKMGLTSDQTQINSDKKIIISYKTSDSQEEKKSYIKIIGSTKELVRINQEDINENDFKKPVQDDMVPNPHQFDLTDVEARVIKLTNEHRVRNSLSILKVHPELMKAARGHSNWMASTGYFQHSGLPYNENIYWNAANADAAVQGWIYSPGHNANMLSGNSWIGVGVMQGYNGLYWTQVFSNFRE